MAGIPTSCRAVVLALRAHHNKEGDVPELASASERAGVSISVTESTRLFDNVLVAYHRKAQLDALTDEQWWAHEFVLHPSQLRFLHHRLV